jgi:hypothetical protein
VPKLLLNHEVTPNADRRQKKPEVSASYENHSILSAFVSFHQSFLDFLSFVSEKVQTSLTLRDRALDLVGEETTLIL